MKKISQEVKLPSPPPKKKKKVTLLDQDKLSDCFILQADFYLFLQESRWKISR